MDDTNHPWPQLPAPGWTPTLETLHLWTQVVGKIRMVLTPWINHSWSVPLYVSPVGLRTSLVPYGSEGFELAFDLTGHELTLVTTTGRRRVHPVGGAQRRRLLPGGDGDDGVGRDAGDGQHDAQRDPRRHPVPGGRDARRPTSRTTLSRSGGRCSTPSG